MASALSLSERTEGCQRDAVNGHLGKIYYKGLNFTTQAVLVLALHIVLGKTPELGVL